VTFPRDQHQGDPQRAELKQAQSDLPLRHDDYVGRLLHQISFEFHQGPKHDSQHAQREAAIAKMIQRFCAKTRPQELIYQDVEESASAAGLNARSGAAGMWQFMCLQNEPAMKRKAGSRALDPIKRHPPMLAKVRSSLQSSLRLVSRTMD